MVIGTDCTGASKSNYNAIMATTAPHCLGRIRYNKCQSNPPVSTEIDMGLFLKDGLVSGVLRHFQQDFSYIVAVF